LLLTPEAFRATEAVEFIAEHLRNEDEYIQVSKTKIHYSSQVEGKIKIRCLINHFHPHISPPWSSRLKTIHQAYA